MRKEKKREDEILKECKNIIGKSTKIKMKNEKKWSKKYE